MVDVSPGREIGSVGSGIAPEAAMKLVSPVSDVVLLLDGDGVIRHADVGAGSAMEDAARGWVGRAWSETVTRETQPKVVDLLEEARSAGASRPRQLNHVARSGSGIPVSYTAVGVGERGVLAVGRDLRVISAMQERLLETQQSIERNHWQRRQIETRYRLLFEMASDGIFVVEAETLRVLDANLSAARLLARSAGEIVGGAALEVFDEASRADVEALLAAAPAAERAGEVPARLVEGGVLVRVGATPFRTEGETRLLMRVVAPRADRDAEPDLAALLQRIPDAFVVTDEEGRIVLANPAFLELAQLTSEERARGRSLGNWVGPPGHDLSMVRAMLRSHGRVRALPTALRGEHGRQVEIELSGAQVPGRAGEGFVGFVLRGAVRPALVTTADSGELGLALDPTELLGRVSLPELVRDTTDLVERRFIRAALELTGGNRTTAAELLGLSRQSLYVKLRRRGLAEASERDEPPTGRPG